MLKFIQSTIVLVFMICCQVATVQAADSSFEAMNPESLNRHTSASSVQSDNVSIYIAAWCPHCRKAKDYLDQLGVQYTVYDIETPTGQEMFEKLNAPGIPIILVGDYRMDGFNAVQLEKVLCEHAVLENCKTVIS